MSRRGLGAAAFLAAWGVLVCGHGAWAQPSTSAPGAGAPVVIEGGPVPYMAVPSNAYRPGDSRKMRLSKERPPKEKPEKDAPSGPAADQGKGADKAKPAEESKTTQRPAKPPKAPDPAELKVRPDSSGKVRFNFTGQAWLDVLQWLADISGMSLDWQELPGDYLNLTTQRSYTVDEARELINEHLVVRGYSMVRRGEVLSVVNLKKLDPATLPRVEPAGLDTRDPSEFVKVSFPLDTVQAEPLVEELKPMLSPYGKLVALSSTNRLEAIDATANLREIREVLAEEQSPGGRSVHVREFALQYARSTEVLEQLHTLLGIEPKSTASKGPMSPDQMQQMMMQQQQQMMQQQNQQGNKPAAQHKPKVEINLVANARRNSIIAHAPPEKMVIIEQAVKTLDVPTDESPSLLANLPRMQVYRLAAIDPEPLAKTLQEVGNLDPKTRLQVDRANKSIIAYATLADHVTIRAVIEKLDGTGRRFEVIPLRRLEADYVAGTIGFLMTGGKEKKQERRPSFFFGDMGSRSQTTDEKPNEFRIEGDVEHSRLLLWANEVEIAEVQNLLIKLGEIPSEKQNPSTVRLLDVGPGKETDEWLERVRKAWPTMGPNPLVLPPPEEAPTPAAPEPARKLPAAPAEMPKSTAVEPWDPYVRLAQLRTPAPADGRAGEGIANPSAAAGKTPEQAGDKAPGSVPDKTPGKPAAPAPITISRTPDGRLMISSTDTRALDQIEELMSQLEPPGRIDYKIFRLKYAWAYGVSLTLKEVFKEDDKDKRRNPFFWDYDYGARDDSDSKDQTRLSKRRPLRIISDSDTNSILIQGADPGQLRKAEDLIMFYDRPDPTDAKSVRKTQTIKLRFAQAKIVADTIKEVYRDLLSANDKALQNNQRDQRPARNYTFVFGDNNGPDEKRAPTFKGLLSIGVDEVANTMIVSAPVFLFEDVSKLIEELDLAAEPTQTTVQVLQLGRGASAANVQETLSRLYGTGSGGGSQHSNPATTPAAGSKQPGRSGSRSAGAQGSGRTSAGGAAGSGR